VVSAMAQRWEFYGAGFWGALKSYDCSGLIERWCFILGTYTSGTWDFLARVESVVFLTVFVLIWNFFWFQEVLRSALSVQSVFLAHDRWSARFL
jgi:hypothetical protein